jgi:DNA-binding GntR family transcriptional regulator
MQTSAQDRAYLHVKNQILSLTLKAGQWIKAQDIATEIEVSRTPVREALSRLEQEGFVRRDEGWGYIVSPVTLKDARELYKMREVLEVEAVREAAVNVTPVDLEALDVLLQRADQARQRKKVKVFRENTRTFHATISRLANNALLSKMLSELECRVQLIGAMVFEKRAQRMDEVIEENGAILEALRRGDAAKAEQEVRRHVRRAWENYLHYVAEGAGFSAAMKSLNNDGRSDGQAAI